MMRPIVIYANSGAFRDRVYSGHRDRLDALNQVVSTHSVEELVRAAVVSKDISLLDISFLLLGQLGRIGYSKWDRLFDRLIQNGSELCRYAWLARRDLKINLSAGRNRRAVQRWFDQASEEDFFNSSGPLPLIDVIRLAHVRARSPKKHAILVEWHNRRFGWNHPVEMSSSREKGAWKNPMGVSRHDLPEMLAINPSRDNEKGFRLGEERLAEELPWFTTAAVLLDVSYSMECSTLSGSRCIDDGVAIAAAYTEKGADVYPCRSGMDLPLINRRDSVATNTQRLLDYHGGGEGISGRLSRLNQEDAKYQHVFLITDRGDDDDGSVTDQWLLFRHRNPGSRMFRVCLSPDANPAALPGVVDFMGFSQASVAALRQFSELSQDKESWDRRFDEVVID